MNKISVLLKETPEKSLTLPRDIYSKKVAVYKPGSRYHQTLNLLAPSSWTF